jgi:hypothetical protein
MKIVKILSVVTAALVMYSCEKAALDPTLDQRPATPVSITNATGFRPDPVVTTSLAAGGKIEISLSVPGGKTIKEITKIATSTSPVQIQSLGSTGWYVATPISVNSSTYTYNTSVSDYFTINPVSKDNPAAKAGAELAYRFYFLVTINDGSKEISMPVRVLVLP